MTENLMIERTLYKTGTPIGDLLLVADDLGLTEIRFLPEGHSVAAKIIGQGESAQFLKETMADLHAYFRGRLKIFRSPIKVRGTAFQKSVWRSLRNLPYGKTMSYKALADLPQHQTSAIAIGQAVAKNPLPIIIPCHRIVGSHGDMVGYRGGVLRKAYLLELERKMEEYIPLDQEHYYNLTGQNTGIKHRGKSAG